MGSLLPLAALDADDRCVDKGPIRCIYFNGSYALGTVLQSHLVGVIYARMIKVSSKLLGRGLLKPADMVTIEAEQYYFLGRTSLIICIALDSILLLLGGYSMRSFLTFLTTFVVAFAPSMVQASELAEALTKLRASFARTSFSHFKAMPLHIRHMVNVGEVIRIQDEQRLIESATCYPDIDIERDNAEEVASVSLSRTSSVLVGLGGESPIYGIPSSANAKFERSIRRNVQSLLVQSSVSYPKMGVVELSSPSGTDSVCLKLFPPAYIPMGPGLLVSTVIEGSLVTRQAIDRNLATTIDASAKLTPRGLPVEVSGNVDTSSNTRTVIAHLRPEGSFAVQSAFISRRVLMEYYALANNDPSTWAELESLIDSYLSGEEPGFVADIGTRILSLWEKLDQPEESLTQYRERLFASEDVQLVERIENLDLPEDAWSRLGTIAAAAEIASTTIEK